MPFAALSTVSTDDSLSKTAGGAQFHIRQNKHTLDVAERERFGTKRGAKHAQMFFLEPKSADTVEIIPVRLEIRKSALYRRGQGGALSATSRVCLFCLM